jgi:hypothetical protein
MKIKTDISTLSKLYPIFEDAGIEGVLTGDLEKISQLTFAGLAGKLLKTGRLAEACEIISGESTFEGMPWEHVSREDSMGVIIPFLIDTTVGPIEPHLMKVGMDANPETSS